MLDPKHWSKRYTESAFCEVGTARVLQGCGWPSRTRCGFRPGYQPGAFTVGSRNGGPGGGHTAVALPTGINFESGGSHGGIAYGGPPAGALDLRTTSTCTCRSVVLPRILARHPSGLARTVWAYLHGHDGDKHGGEKPP